MNKLFSKISIKVAIVLALVFVLGLYLAPRKVSHTLAEVCSPVYDRPILNPYPISSVYFAGQVKDDCTDFPTLAVRNVNQNQYLQNISAQDGDEMFVQAYVHNGATPNSSDDSLNMALNLNASFTNTGNGFSVYVSGDNVNSISGNVYINIPSGSSLEVVPGSGVIRDISGGQTSTSVAGDNFNVFLGNQKACFNFARFIQFKVRVVAGQTSVKNGTISATSGNQIGNQCLRTGNVTWSSNVYSAEVYVKDLDTGVENLYSGDTDGNGETPWLVPSDRYLYTLYSTEDGQKQKLAEYTLQVPSLNCATPVVNIPASGSISANFTNPIAGQCLYTGRVYWQTQNTNNVQVFVKDETTGIENLHSGELQAYQPGNETPWLVPGDRYSFTLYDLSSGQKVRLDQASFTVPALNCSPAVVGRASGFITATFTNRIGNQCLYTGYVYWSTQNVNSAQVYVKDLNTGVENLHAGETQKAFPGNDTPWLTPGHSYLYTLYNTENGQKVKLSDYTVNVPNLNCVTPVVTGNKDFSFEIDNNLCVGYIPHYRIQATSNLSYKLVRIISKFNGISVGDNTLGSTDGSSFWSYADTAWTSAQVGSWSKTANIDGVEKTINFNVRDCSTQQVLSCSPASQTVNVGQTASFSAFGGSGIYTWSAPNSSQTSGSGSYFSTVYSNSATGNQTVTLQSGSQSQTCSVYVNPVNTQSGILSINKTVKNLTSGSGYSKTITAENGNRVSYQIAVSANNSAVNNVVVNESLPSGFNYISGTLKVDGQSVSDGQLNSINLYNLSSGQTKTITLEGYVSAYSGQCQTTLTNTASASGSGSATVSDSATVYINQSCGGGGGGGGYAQLSISKLVRNQNSSSYFSESVNAQNGDRVQFQITVRNIGNTSANNVRVRDFWNAGLSLVGYTVSVDGQSYSGSSIIDSDLSIGSLSVNQQKTITFEATVFASGVGSIQNTARATADNASQVSDDAWVFLNNSQVLGGNVNLSYQKRAFNETKNADAQSVTASREDFITYTLTVSNNGNAPANSFVITDDLSGVLNYADISDYGGGTLSGSVLSFPNVTVPAYGSVSKSFKVRVKYNLPSTGSFVMNNSYGNTVSVRIGNPVQPTVLGAFVAPKTGADTRSIAFAGLTTILFALYRKKQFFLKWF